MVGWASGEACNNIHYVLINQGKTMIDNPDHTMHTGINGYSIGQMKTHLLSENSSM